VTDLLAISKQSESKYHCDEGERTLRVKSSMRVGRGLHTSSTLSCRGFARHRSRASWEKVQDTVPARCLGSEPLGDGRPSRHPDAGQHCVPCGKNCPALSAAAPGIDMSPPADCVICAVRPWRRTQTRPVTSRVNTGIIIMHTGPASKINLLGGMAHHSPTVGPISLWKSHPLTLLDGCFSAFALAPADPIPGPNWARSATSASGRREVGTA